MPLYEFYCPRCRKKVEELCSGAVDTTACPGCGGEAKRVFSTFRTAKSGSGGGSTGGCGG